MKYQPQVVPNVDPTIRSWLDTEHRRIAQSVGAITEQLDLLADVAFSGDYNDLDNLPTLVTDHGALTGLSDDDHPQYTLAAGTETISGAWTFSTNPTLTDSVELRFGTGGDDLAIYHNGTQNFIDSNTGDIDLRYNGVAELIVSDGYAAYRDDGGTERRIGISFNPFKPSNENSSRDITRADVGRTLNCATGSVTYTIQAESEAGWILGDTIEFTAQTTGVVTVATEGSGIRAWRGDGQAILTLTTFDLIRAGRVLVQYIGSDLWDVVRGSEAIASEGPDWTVTNVSTNRSCDANGALAAIGDNLATLINDLIAKGILQ